jgi:CRP/FNR family cyclic AMP-dependent transcriptional regulator
MPLRLEPVRDRKLYRLVKAAEERRARKGEVVYRRGDGGGLVFMVREGHVCLRLPAPAGDQRTVAVAGPWELFGEEGMVPGTPRPYTAVAAGRCVVLALEGAAVRTVLRTSQHTLTTYLEVKERELERVRAAASGSPGPTARQRLAAVLLDLAERFGERDPRGVHLRQWFTHRELADLAGAHRSTVTTSLNDWIWEGSLATEGRSLILTGAGLDALASEAAGSAPLVDQNPRQD